MANKDLIIKSHARRRYIERIHQPDHYKHLGNCKISNCKECAKLQDDITCVANCVGRKIDWKIATAYREAKQNNWVITDPSFIDAIKDKYGVIDSAKKKFYRNRDMILVLVEDDEIPTLVTVLNVHMVDGTTIDAFAGTEKMAEVFDRWKFQARQKR